MTSMTHTLSSSRLRLVLQANSVFSALSGLLFLLGGSAVSSFLGLDVPFVVSGIGLGLLLYAVWLFRIATRSSINRQDVLLAVLMDSAWVVGSVFLLLTGWPPLTTAGKWVVAIVADIVALFAFLQYRGMRELRA
ncbi:MAG: hypothetical protein ACRDIB_00705 [Ardenticatenaceae bacterium]